MEPAGWMNCQAAILRAKIRQLDAWNGARRANTDSYDRFLRSVSGVVPPERSSFEEPFSISTRCACSSAPAYKVSWQRRELPAQCTTPYLYISSPSTLRSINGPAIYQKRRKLLLRSSLFPCTRN